LSEYGGAYLSMGNYVELLREQLSLVKAKYQEAKVDAEKNIAAKFIINRGYIAEKKIVPYSMAGYRGKHGFLSFIRITIYYRIRKLLHYK
jgi:hypothetical protein